MKISKKLVILVMSSTTIPEYVDLEKSIKNTWYNSKNEDVEIIFYKDNQNLSPKYTYPVFDGCDLVLPIDDGFYTLNQKTLMAFDWVCQNYEFDYIFRTNLGSFIDVDNIISFLSDKPKEKFYCGVFGHDNTYFGQPVLFVSGSGYFLSRDIVLLVLKNLQNWPWRVVDDVALGYVIVKQLGIDINQEGIRKDICDGEVIYVKGDKIVDSLDEELIYHYRLRSQDRNKDIKTMMDLYNKNSHNLVNLNYGTFLEKSITKPGLHFINLCNIPSDINEHMPTLKRYAEECDSVTEMGVRHAYSTWAFIEAKPKKLTGIDINYNFFEASEKYINGMCNNYNIDFDFIEGDTLEMKIENTDLLFIDTLHTYSQLLQELNNHHVNVNKYIILHDIVTFGYIDEYIYNHASDKAKDIFNKSGLVAAVEEFIENNNNWQIKEIFTNNNGLLILFRV